MAGGGGAAARRYSQYARAKRSVGVPKNWVRTPILGRFVAFFYFLDALNYGLITGRGPFVFLKAFAALWWPPLVAAHIYTLDKMYGMPRSALGVVRASYRTRGARGGGPVSGARRPRAGRYRPTMPPRLNSQVTGF